MAYATMIPTSGTTATDGTTHGMIPGTAGMAPTIATAMQAGTTGVGAGTTTDGTIPGTMVDTTEAIMVATMTGITDVNRQLQLAITDNALLHITADPVAAAYVMVEQEHLAQPHPMALAAPQELTEPTDQ